MRVCFRLSTLIVVVQDSIQDAADVVKKLSDVSTLFFKHFFLKHITSASLKEQVGIVSHYMGFGKEQEPDVSTATTVKDVSLEFDDFTKDVLEGALKMKDDPQKEIVQALQSYKLGRDIVIRAERRLATLDQHGKSEIQLHDIRADFEKSLFEWTVSDVESIDTKLGALGFSDQTKTILASKTMERFFRTAKKAITCRLILPRCNKAEGEAGGEKGGGEKADGDEEAGGEKGGGEKADGDEEAKMSISALDVLLSSLLKAEFWKGLYGKDADDFIQDISQ